MKYPILLFFSLLITLPKSGYISNYYTDISVNRINAFTGGEFRSVSWLAKKYRITEYRIRKDACICRYHFVQGCSTICVRINLWVSELASIRVWRYMCTCVPPDRILSDDARCKIFSGGACNLENLKINFYMCTSTNRGTLYVWQHVHNFNTLYCPARAKRRNSKFFVNRVSGCMGPILS